MKIVFILTGLLALVILLFALFYLTRQIYRLSFVQKAARRSRKLQLLMAAVILGLVIGGMVWWLNGINMIVCPLHWAAFWLICSGVARVIAKYRGRRVNRDLAGLAAVAVTVCYLAVGWVLAHNVVETDYHFETQKKVEPLRIVLFSDAHIGATFDGDGFAEQMAAINTQDPDLVLIAGDFVDDGTSRENMLEAWRSASNTGSPIWGLFCLWQP